MNILKGSLCGLFVAMGASGAALAETAFSVGAGTSYTFHGIKQTYDRDGGDSPHVFAAVDWTGSGVYAGAWATNTGRSDDNGIEYDIYGGWRPVVGAVTLDVGATFYGFTDSRLGTVSSDSNTLEFKLAASMPVGSARVAAVAAYAPEAGDSGESGLYTELSASVPFRDVLVSGAVGRTTSDALGGPDHYMTWNFGVTAPIGERLSLDARLIDTDGDARRIFGSRAAQTQLVATLKASF